MLNNSTNRIADKGVAVFFLKLQAERHNYLVIS